MSERVIVSVDENETGEVDRREEEREVDRGEERREKWREEGEGEIWEYFKMKNKGILKEGGG